MKKRHHKTARAVAKWQHTRGTLHFIDEQLSQFRTTQKPLEIHVPCPHCIIVWAMSKGSFYLHLALHSMVHDSMMSFHCGRALRSNMDMCNRDSTVRRRDTEMQVVTREDSAHPRGTPPRRPEWRLRRALCARRGVGRRAVSGRDERRRPADVTRPCPQSSRLRRLRVDGTLLSVHMSGAYPGPPPKSPFKPTLAP